VSDRHEQKTGSESHQDCAEEKTNSARDERVARHQEGEDDQTSREEGGREGHG